MVELLICEGFEVKYFKTLAFFFALFFIFGTYKLHTFARALRHDCASKSSLFFVFFSFLVLINFLHLRGLWSIIMLQSPRFFFVLFSNYCLADRGNDMCYFISLFNCRPMCNQGRTPFKLSTHITLFVYCMPMPTFKRCYFYNNSKETYHTYNKHV